MRALGLDLGSRRIGVAICDVAGTLATPYETIARGADHSTDHRRIAELAAEAGVEVVVVGLPLHLDGRLSPAARATLAEAEELRVATGLAVETYDERLTTVSAERSLRAMNITGPARRKMIDQLAATVMLQAWLDHRGAADDVQPPPP